MLFYLLTLLKKAMLSELGVSAKTSSFLGMKTANSALSAAFVPIEARPLKKAAFKTEISNVLFTELSMIPMANACIYRQKAG